MFPFGIAHGKQANENCIAFVGEPIVVEVSDSAGLRFCSIETTNKDLIMVPGVVQNNSLACNAPAHLAGDVSIDVSVNARDSSGSGMKLTYVTAPAVDFMAPLLGPKNGDTQGTIQCLTHGTFYIICIQTFYRSSFNYK